ncbi:hypothetical protein ACFL2G_03170 [Candidatus Omnitrophota bacterium]
MTEKKSPPKAVIVFAWVDILFGLLALIFFIYGLSKFLYSIQLIQNSSMPVKGYYVSRDLGRALFCLSLPGIPFLILGLGVLKLIPLAKKITLNLSLFYVVSLILVYVLDELLRLPIMKIPIQFFFGLFLFSLSQLLFFTRSKVKELFSK